MPDLNHYPNYPLIGERFENVDTRNEGRVIRVLSFATDKNAYEIPGKYRVEVIADPLNPSNVGHKYSAWDQALTDSRRYRKVSR